MKKFIVRISIATLYFLYTTAVSSSQPIKKILPRKDCFFGVHFDFHANPDDNQIGQNVTTQSIDQLLTKIQPDFIQVDCKGHPGIASYPTKVGTPAKGFVKDVMPLWRSETAKYGIGLYVHYSDLIDKAVIQRHPKWASVNANGQASNEVVSVFSGYEDSLLIPQLKEVITNYKVDGVWLDGGAWAMQPDYSAASAKAFRMQTGIHELPKNATSSSYKSFLSFERSAFASYVNRYATALHKFDNNIEICSNWLYSGMAPLPVPSGINFLSADIPSLHMDLNMVAFTARCYSSQAMTYKKAWDLMSWGFDDKGIRPVNVLCREASEVIAEGGAWQCYFPQNRDASVRQDYINTLASLSPFIRARQRYCQYAVPIKQVAVLLSGENEFTKNTGIFQNDNNTSVRNTLYTLLDNQYVADVVMEHQLTSGIPAYPLLVIPELGTAKKFQAQLLKYVSNGGTVLLLGTSNIEQAGAYTGVNFTGEINANNSVLLSNNTGKYQFSIPFYNLQKGTQAIQNILDGNAPVAVTKTYGKGKIASFFINQSSASNDDMYEAYKSAIAGVVKSLLPNPLIEVTGSKNIHVTVTRLKNETVVNLINTSKFVNGTVPELSSITVNLRIPKPARLTLQPENKPLSFIYHDGICTIQIQRLQLHEMIIVGQ